jgi:NAD(P)-dependent dehydrogenase (short-subunit alcohol dehydrogenase family)
MKYIIVGGTSGIGLATAKMAVESGHSVVAGSVREVQRAQGNFVILNSKTSGEVLKENSGHK